ncbi:hypothetical protein LIER_20775 [Lithospermum erythrorhizon]|uniref:K-box domain-containing protein n=1 Tax=Lithospermum erythrorhizon TaxID=34254 RepID=A0AAV3QMR2_LITER
MSTLISGRIVTNSMLTSLSETVQRFTSYAEKEEDSSISACGSEKDHRKFGAIMSIRELLEKVESHLEDPDQLSTHDVTYLEEQLEAALLETRARKTCLMLDSTMSLKEKEKLLKESNRLLEEEIALNRAKINEETMKFDGMQNSTPHMHTFF